MSQTPAYPPTDPNTSMASDMPWVQHHIIDELHQQMIVGTFAHPRDWAAHSQLVWNFQDTAWPATTYASVFNPRGTEAVELLPTESCFWIGPNFLYAPGQKYRGQTCLAPLGAAEALVQFFIPKYRSGQPNLRLRYVQAVPQLAQVLHSDWLQTVSHEGVMACIEYGPAGRSWTEEFYACVMWHPPAGGQQNWGIIAPFCLRAASAQIDAARPQLWRIATSLKMNPTWTQLHQQVLNELNTQTQVFFDSVRAKQAAELEYGRKLSSYIDWQSNMSQQQFNSWWAADERRQGWMGDMIQGTQRFPEPSSQVGAEHVDYTQSRYSWTNGRGDWLHTDDAGYNPNADPTQMARGFWHLAQPL